MFGPAHRMSARTGSPGTEVRAPGAHEPPGSGNHQLLPMCASLCARPQFGESNPRRLARGVSVHPLRLRRSSFPVPTEAAGSGPTPTPRTEAKRSWRRRGSRWRRSAGFWTRPNANVTYLSADSTWNWKPGRRGTPLRLAPERMTPARESPPGSCNSPRNATPISARTSTSYGSSPRRWPPRAGRMPTRI